MEKLEEIIKDIQEDAKRKIEASKKDYYAGKQDCRIGIYDKWYRYNRKDDGIAYDSGWQEENNSVKNENVKFLYDEII